MLRGNEKKEQAEESLKYMWEKTAKLNMVVSVAITNTLTKTLTYWLTVGTTVKKE